MQKAWDIAGGFRSGLHSFRSYAGTYDEMFAQCVTKGSTDMVVFVDEWDDIEATLVTAAQRLTQ